MKYYTVYDNRTDKVIAFGSAEECASALHLQSVSSFYCLVSRKGGRYSVVSDKGRIEVFSKNGSKNF